MIFKEIQDCLLYHGDCLEIMPHLKKVDAVITDPPYGTTQCKWDTVIDFDLVWFHLKKLRKSDKVPFVLFGSEPFSSFMRVSNINEFKYDWIWDKIKGTGFLNAKKQPMRNHEIISVFYKSQCNYYPQKTKGHELKEIHRKPSTDNIYNAHDANIYCSTERYPRSIQVFSSDTQHSSLHPTQKPQAALEYLIETYTQKGDTVLDFTMGSGTTLAACAKLKRRGIGIEKDKKYFDIACQRVKDQYKQADLFY